MSVEERSKKLAKLDVLHASGNAPATEVEAYSLEKGDILHLGGDPRGSEIVCLKGILWITQQADHQDYVLESGKTFIVSRRGKVVIEACTDALFSLHSAKIIPHDMIDSEALIGNN